MLFSHKRALPSNYVFKYKGHSLNPLPDANISAMKALVHVRQEEKMGNIFTFPFNKNHVNIYIFFEDGGKKTSVTYYTKDLNNDLLQSIAEWKLLQQKQKSLLPQNLYLSCTVLVMS